MCGHCKAMAPEYKKAAEKLKGLVKVVAIDCDSHQQLCGQYGFPTVRLFQSNKKSSPLDYQGPRTAKAFIKYAVSQLPATHLTSVSAKKPLQTFLDSKDLGRALLVSSKSSIPPLLKSLSLEYKDRLSFALVKESDSESVKTLNVAKAPALVLFPKESDEAVAYNGELKYAELKKFLDKYAPEKLEKRSEGKSKSKKESKTESKKETETPQEPFDPSIPAVTTQAELQSLCTEKPGICIVSFLGDEEDESIQAELKKSLTVLSAVKKAQYEKKSHKTMLPGLIAINGRKKAYRPFRGAFDEASINSFLKDMLTKGPNFEFKFEPQLDDKPAQGAMKTESSPAVEPTGEPVVQKAAEEL
ncbi:hypothetical protein BJ742DRAFT_207049 [Cladochytrium replicatum]|nr:hypothetical protein BJ742DRAFT_207049 [Cladochytrium replicatum]